MPDTSTSMCSDMVRTVRGLAESLITGTIGLPMMLPCPVGNRCTTKPAAATSVISRRRRVHEPQARAGRRLGLVEHAVNHAFLADFLDVSERLFLDCREATQNVAFGRLRVHQVARLVPLDQLLVAIEHGHELLAHRRGA